MQTEFPDSDIRYVSGEGNLNSEAIKFTKPIVVNKTTTVKASVFEDDKPTGIVFEETITFHNGVASKVNYETKYHKRYKGTEAFNLVNTLRGTKNFRDGRWQAWLNKDAKFTLDLGEEKNISKVTVGSMVNDRNSIYYPTGIDVLVSTDGENFTKVGKIEKPFEAHKEPALKDFVLDFEVQKSKYVKVEATFNEKGTDVKEAWIFIDEVLID